MKFDSIGKNLRKYRIAKNLRQEDIAEMTGLSSNYIGMIERGEKIPSLETFISLLNTLEASADIILSDMLNNGYIVKNSILNEQILKLSKVDQELIYDVINTIIYHSNQGNKSQT